MTGISARKVICKSVNYHLGYQHISKQECIPVGCVPSAAVAVGGGWGCLEGVCPGGVCPGGCLPGGVSAQGWGVSAWGLCVSQHALGRGCLPRGCVCIPAPVHAGIPHWTEFLTHACENITFPQLRCGR